jgi:hypothetical protein
VRRAGSLLRAIPARRRLARAEAHCAAARKTENAQVLDPENAVEQRTPNRKPLFPKETKSGRAVLNCNFAAYYTFGINEP